jgi:hypothetical protein
MHATNDYTIAQGEMWSHVEEELGRSRVASPTRSFSACLSVRAPRLVEAHLRDVQPPAEANGLAVMRANEPVWIEVLPRRDDLCAVVPNVVADLLEARPQHPAVFALARARAANAIHAITTSAPVSLAPLPNTAGESYALDGPEVAGFMLLLGGRVAHVAARIAY